MTMLTIGALGKAADCRPETIRFYEQKGLLDPHHRTAGGHRKYSEDTLRRLLFIRRSRGLGFSMLEIQNLLGIVDGDHPSCRDVEAQANAHLRDIRSKIRDLRRMEGSLSNLVSQCSGQDVPHCPLLDDLMAVEPR